MSDAEYTKEMVSVGLNPAVGMLCRAEFNCSDMGLQVVNFTFKFKGEHEYVGTDKDGFAMAINFNEFIAWHHVDNRSELEIAKDKQVKSVASMLFERDEFGNDFIEQAKFLQDNGMLSEIMLPLEK